MLSVIEKTYTLPPGPTGYVEHGADIEDYIREHYGPASRVNVTLSQDRWKITTNIDLDQEDLRELTRKIKAHAKEKRASAGRDKDA